MATARGFGLTQREKIALVVEAESAAVNKAVAGEIASLIRDRAARGQRAVLGLATGSTPVGVYGELIRLHREEGLSFKNVVTFNLDEYYPMRPGELQSYRRFMNERLFDHIDIDPANTHVPDGMCSAEQLAEFCRGYERAIAEAGGLDIQILGIGRTGHIGFNEPGSARDSRTRLITLDRMTRLDAAGDFYGDKNVPPRAITMGVGSILSARRIILMAFGENKAPVVARAVEGAVSAQVPASFLQDHPHAMIYLDRAAAADLTRFKNPWLVGPVNWDARTTLRAVIWLAMEHQKPILKLTDEDYNESGLQDLLASHGSAHAINIDVFRALQERITGWPGGKPDPLKRPGDIRRSSDSIFPKRVVVFAPHPDDDVISMGGTLIRLADHGHEVHVGYQTSGNIAVSDADALRFADFASDFSKLFGIEAEAATRIERHIEEFLRQKKPGQVDSAEVQRLRTLIRRGEARAAGRECGIPEDRLHFLDMPFYETGTVRKRPLGEEDIGLIVALLERVKPHQIYAAGDLSDPHGTHRVCLTAIHAAIERVRNQPWFNDCEVWLYRGAWQEWEPDQIDMAVPLSPTELMRKRAAIFKHQSQKDRAMYPGHDDREFWQRSEARNRNTAQLYDKLGMAEYAGIEGFVRWRPPENAEPQTLGAKSADKSAARPA